MSVKAKEKIITVRIYPDNYNELNELINKLGKTGVKIEIVAPETKPIIINTPDTQRARSPYDFPTQPQVWY